jgi:hypothetical protein
MEILQLPWSRRYCPPNCIASCLQDNFSTWTTQKKSLSIVVEVCLPRRCIATVAVRTTQKTRFLYCHMHICFGRYLATTTVYLVTAPSVMLFPTLQSIPIRVRRRRLRFRCVCFGNSVGFLTILWFGFSCACARIVSHTWSRYGLCCFTWDYMPKLSVIIPYSAYQIFSILCYLQVAEFESSSKTVR